MAEELRMEKVPSCYTRLGLNNHASWVLRHASHWDHRAPPRLA